MFRWDEVRTNLPGSPDYDPTKTWVFKIWLSDGKIAADIVIYVDDLRIMASSRKEAWLAAHKTCSIMSWLGLQDAARKRRKCSQSPGAWAGSVVRIHQSDVVILIAEDKWIKMKGLLQEISDTYDNGVDCFDRKQLKEIRGFLQYICQTYQWMNPYMMGFHLTIDGWRSN